jgi:two-component system chemotaxis response regulator CheB
VTSASPIRVVVIDDSAYNRQTIATMLESDPGIQVVGRAADGDDGLKLVLRIQPDLVTLDLEMPRMDGFTFLRILMSRRPTPVIVVSGLGAKENVFKALELGALDFVVKPSRQISPELRTIQEDLVAKVRLVNQLRMLPLTERAQRPEPAAPSRISSPSLSLDPLAEPPQSPCPVGPAPSRLVAIGASTGGPPALQQLLAAIDPRLPVGVVVTQHMPPRFTRAFAERLQRASRLVVREAEDGDYVTAGSVLVAPGSGSLALYREDDTLRVSIEPPARNVRFTPSVDRMLETAAQAMGEDLLGVVLTGMGGDGGRGVRVVKSRGGRVVAEAADTAVIFGMPNEAIATGSVDEVLPLGRIAEAIERFARRG